MTATDMTRLDCIQESGASFRFPVWVTVAQTLRSPFAAFPGTLVGNWIGSGTAGKTVTLVEWQHCRLNLLSYRAGPSIDTLCKCNQEQNAFHSVPTWEGDRPVWDLGVSSRQGTCGNVGTRAQVRRMSLENFPRPWSWAGCR